jgi:natural product precursor
MKKNKKIKKLQFTKETIARLEEAQLNHFQGGTNGPITSELPAFQCTITGETVGHNRTCNAKLCITK